MTGAAAAAAAMATVREEVLAARRWRWRWAVRRERRIFIHGVSDVGTGGVTEVEAGVSGDKGQGKAREFMAE